MTGLMTFSMMSARICSIGTSPVCVEITTASTRKRPAVAIFDRNLRFSVRTQIGNRAVAANLRSISRQIMGHLDRHRHQLGRLVTGKAEHQALIAGTAGINALRNIGRLRTDSVDNAAGVRIVADTRVVVADLFDSFANDLLVIDRRRRRDLTGNDRQTRRDKRFTSNAGPSDPAPK